MALTELENKILKQMTDCPSFFRYDCNPATGNQVNLNATAERLNKALWDYVDHTPEVYCKVCRLAIACITGAAGKEDEIRKRFVKGINNIIGRSFKELSSCAEPEAALPFWTDVSMIVRDITFSAIDAGIVARYASASPSAFLTEYRYDENPDHAQFRDDQERNWKEEAGSRLSEADFYQIATGERPCPLQLKTWYGDDVAF